MADTSRTVLLSEGLRRVKSALAAQPNWKYTIKEEGGVKADYWYLTGAEVREFLGGLREAERWVDAVVKKLNGEGGLPMEAPAPIVRASSPKVAPRAVAEPEGC